MLLRAPRSLLVFSNTSVPAGNTVANTTSETAFTSQPVIGAGSLKVGDILRLTMRGVYSTALVAPNLTGKLKWGSTVLLNTGTLSSFVNSVSNLAWSAIIDLTICSIGASGSVEAHGALTFATSATVSLSINVANTAPITIDTTSAGTLSTTVQWSAASASNTITLRQAICELLRA